jgi:hypothetical protein
LQRRLHPAGGRGCLGHNPNVRQQKRNIHTTNPRALTPPSNDPKTGCGGYAGNHPCPRFSQMRPHRFGLFPLAFGLESAGPSPQIVGFSKLHLSISPVLLKTRPRRTLSIRAYRSIRRRGRTKPTCNTSPDGHSIARRGAGAGNDDGEKAYFAVCETDFPVAHIPEYAGLEG